MTTREEAIAACLALPFVYEDYPFGEEWAVMRHLENKKTFAMIFLRQGNVWLTVKAEPMWGDFWRQSYSAIVPAYHCNKRHWISIILDGSVPEEEILHILRDSFALTRPKRRRKSGDTGE